jgi:hypothetical protein
MSQEESDKTIMLTDNTDEQTHDTTTSGEGKEETVDYCHYQQHQLFQLSTFVRTKLHELQETVKENLCQGLSTVSSPSPAEIVSEPLTTTRCVNPQEQHHAGISSAVNCAKTTRSNESDEKIQVTQARLLTSKPSCCDGRRQVLGHMSLVGSFDYVASGELTRRGTSDESNNHDDDNDALLVTWKRM